MRPGELLEPLRVAPITRAQLRAYQAAVGADNPIHVDDAAAVAAGFDGAIAHGQLVMGLLGRYVVALVGPAAVQRLKVRFQAVVYPGDSLTCQGEVREVAADRATLALWAENQRGDRVASGEATVGFGGVSGAGVAAADPSRMIDAGA